MAASTPRDHSNSHSSFDMCARDTHMNCRPLYENLNWKPHIQLVKSKLSKTLSIMYKASKLINYEGMFTL